MGKKQRRVESRSLLPGGSSFDDTPNDNDPVPPVSVGPQATPGDPQGVVLVSEGSPAPWPRSVVRPSPWSGWPAEWDTPLWGGQVASRNPTAWMCVDLNSRIFAAMPPYLVGAAQSLNADWLNNPDPDRYGSWYDFARELMWDLFDCGEAFVLQTAPYSTGWPARFHVVTPSLVNVDTVGGLRRYSIGGADVTDEIRHIGYFMRSTEARGHGPHEAIRQLICAAEVLSRYAFNVVAGGGLPTGVLEHPDELTAEQSADLQAQWVTARQASMGLPAVISGGVTFKADAFSPTDLALVELSKWYESRIAVAMCVPPFLVGLPSGGDSMTYSNVEQIFKYHWRAGFGPHVVNIMRSLSEWLLPHGTTVEVNRDEYLKADGLTRAQMWQIYNTMGVLDSEQIAEAERFNVAAPSATLTSGVLQ